MCCRVPGSFDFLEKKQRQKMLKTTYGTNKPIIAMIHLQPLPGSPRAWEPAH